VGPVTKVRRHEDCEQQPRGVSRAANADVGSIEALWVDEVGQHISPIGAKGIGQIGITGTAAAIANAVYHAAGKRVRDLPITLHKLL
jgi:xanthine dehydrogenase YagR molybdenum-binding subunit